LSQEQQLQSITKVKLKLIKIKSINYIFYFHSDSTHFNAKLMELWKKFQDKALSSKELMTMMMTMNRMTD
jgi:hypothetical protein